MEIVEAGRQAGEPIELILARVRNAYPRMSEAALRAEVNAYLLWLQKAAEEAKREGERLLHEGESMQRIAEIAKPAWDEKPNLTVAEVLKVMADRGSEEARLALQGLGP